MFSEGSISVQTEPLVSVIAPMFNEESSIAEFVRRLQSVSEALSERYEFESVLVDDGSRDDTLRIAKSLCATEPRLRVVELRRNHGQTAALQAGMNEARGGIVISMDADLQHFPENIPRFLDKIESGCDVVCGWRNERREGVVRRWPSRVANALIRKISGLTIHDVGTTFRAYRSEIVKDLHLQGEHHRFIPVFANVAGARIDEVPIDNVARPHGESNYGLGRTLNVFIDLFFLFFYTRYLDRPIRIFGKLAVLSFASGGVISAYLFWIWVATGTPVVRQHSGLFTIAVILYLAAIQLITTGVLTELVSRVYFAKPGNAPYKIRRIWQGETSSLP